MGTAVLAETESEKYSKCISTSKRIRWDIDTDVIKNRSFDLKDKFLPDSLSKINEFNFLNADEKRFLSQIQGRTYANIFGLVERFINAKVLEISQEYVLGDQVALEAMIRFSDEELKHQKLFRRIEKMTGELMPDGYKFVPSPNDVANIVLSKSTWSVLGLTCHIELFTQVHYKKSIEPDNNLSDLYKDVFLFHWKEESQHAILDELEWTRENNKISDSERDQAVTDLIDLVLAVDGILQIQSIEDSNYFKNSIERQFSDEERKRLDQGLLSAYRWQYIVSGVQDPRFMENLTNKVNQNQLNRITIALTPLMA